MKLNQFTSEVLEACLTRIAIFLNLFAVRFGFTQIDFVVLLDAMFAEIRHEMSGFLLASWNGTQCRLSQQYPGLSPVSWSTGFSLLISPVRQAKALYSNR